MKNIKPDIFDVQKVKKRIISDVFRKYYKDEYFNQKIIDEIIKIHMMIRIKNETTEYEKINIEIK